jgi:hypothetical protein
VEYVEINVNYYYWTLLGDAVEVRRWTSVDVSNNCCNLLNWVSENVFPVFVVGGFSDLVWKFVDDFDRVACWWSRNITLVREHSCHGILNNYDDDDDEVVVLNRVT